MRNRNILYLAAGVIALIEIIISVILKINFNTIFAPYLFGFAIINVIFLFVSIYILGNVKVDKEEILKETFDNNYIEAFDIGKIWIIKLHQDFTVEDYISGFANEFIDFEGKKISEVIPEVTKIFQGETDKILAHVGDKYFEIFKDVDDSVLFFKDVSEYQTLLEKYNNESPVIGMATLDNYDETIYHSTEQTVFSINTNIRQAVIDWCAANELMAKSYHSNAFVIFTNEEKFWKVANQRFDILKTVRDSAEELEVPISLSMSFAYGDSDFLKLEEMVNNQLKMVENRGGDQVAICKAGGEIEFVGGNSEISENRSGVRARVMSQAIRDKINASEKIYIIPHQNMDLDCLGAALGVSLIARSLGRPAFIVCNNIEIEKKTTSALVNNFEELSIKHNFITEEDALADNSPDTLTIIVDHQTYDLSAAPSLAKAATKTIIIDHHRRRKTEIIPASMIYLETSSSSTTELITEMIQNNPNKIELLDIEANIMFAGILVDTNYFRSHSGSRTFMAAAELKKMGADASKADELLKDTYKEFGELRTVSSKAHIELEDYIIADVDDSRKYDRATLSKACDNLLQIREVKAAFVIGRIDEETVGITARSNGEVNVQVIMEKMHGGGHFQAAAMQRKNTTVKELNEELLKVLNEYKKENEQ